MYTAHRESVRAVRVHRPETKTPPGGLDLAAHGQRIAHFVLHVKATDVGT